MVPGAAGAPDNPVNGTVEEAGYLLRWVWRRGWDSNPRGTLAPTGFQDRRFQPLSHLSGGEYSTGWKRVSTRGISGNRGGTGFLEDRGDKAYTQLAVWQGHHDDVSAPLKGNKGFCPAFSHSIEWKRSRFLEDPPARPAVIIAILLHLDGEAAGAPWAYRLWLLGVYHRPSSP